MDLAIELVKLGTVGLLAGLFSSILANRDHRSRRWWEMRVVAYQSAIDALSDLVYYYDRHLRAEARGSDLPAEYKKKMDAAWDASFPKVRRLADSGAFLFSDRANAALHEFIEDDDAPTYFEHLDNNLAKSRKCLRELVACSKQDLSLKESIVERWLP